MPLKSGANLMPKRPPGLTLDPQGNDFVLRRTTPDGKTRSLVLSDDDVLSLAQSAPLFRGRILSKRNPEGGTLSAVYATPVVQIGLAPDALGENILLTLIAPSDAEVTFELPPHIVGHLVQRLPAHLARALAAKPSTRQ
jgi:hypothetical protein